MIEDHDLEQRLAEALEAEKRRVFAEWGVEVPDGGRCDGGDDVD